MIACSQSYLHVHVCLCVFMYYDAFTISEKTPDEYMIAVYHSTVASNNYGTGTLSHQVTIVN